MKPHKAPLLSLRGISKQFGSLKANDNVSLTLQRGEIHALLGENGAGKSTLVKILYGVQQPDSGEIAYEGRSRFFSSPREARAHGVNMVFQHFALFEGMSVLENIALGLDEKLDLSGLKRRLEVILGEYSLPLDPERHVHTLSVGERQRVEIVRCLLQNPKLLIMDEPTSVLTPQEVEGLFGILRQLKNNGCSILYISHKLHEIQALCDTATILRGGRVVATLDPSKVSASEMAEAMIGEPVKPLQKRTHALGEVRLQAKNLSLSFNDPFATDLSNINFEVRAGEILGIAGVAGNGQSELALALSGEISVEKSCLTLNNQEIGAIKPHIRRQNGLLTLPEERNGHAAVPSMSLAENTLLTARNREGLSHKGIINSNKMQAFAAQIIKIFGVKTQGTRTNIGALSGGNVQKFIIGREILQNPDVLVVSQPTWGVDAGAASHIRQQLITLAEKGAAIIVLSQDLDELFELCDALAVIAGGSLSEIKPISAWTTQSIGLAMAGAKHV
jgi:general nucleoside transport system ATP-binding protein